MAAVAFAIARLLALVVDTVFDTLLTFDDTNVVVSAVELVPVLAKLIEPALLVPVETAADTAGALAAIALLSTVVDSGVNCPV
jgi:hypothetical protein